MKAGTQEPRGSSAAGCLPAPPMGEALGSGFCIAGTPTRMWVIRPLTRNQDTGYNASIVLLLAGDLST